LVEYLTRTWIKQQNAMSIITSPIIPGSHVSREEGSLGGINYSIRPRKLENESGKVESDAYG
jgi:hypothetical protein